MKIRLDITPETAKLLGYVWMQDVIYDPEAPAEVMADIIKMVDSGEYVLGKCASNNPENGLVGLYKKIK